MWVENFSCLKTRMDRMNVTEKCVRHMNGMDERYQSRPRKTAEFAEAVKRKTGGCVETAG